LTAPPNLSYPLFCWSSRLKQCLQEVSNPYHRHHHFG